MPLRFLHNEEEAIAIVLGDDAHDFFKSNVGIFVMQRLTEKIKAASEKLSTCDPEDSKIIRSLQNEIKLAKMLPGFLNELIVAGETAERNLALEDGNST